MSDTDYLLPSFLGTSWRSTGPCIELKKPSKLQTGRLKRQQTWRHRATIASTPNSQTSKSRKGQFSIVYRARCLANDKVVALKKIQVSTKWYLSHVPHLDIARLKIRRKIQSFVPWLARCFSEMPYFNRKFTWLNSIIPVETKSTQDVLWKLMCKYGAFIDSRPVVILLRQPCLVEFSLICCGNCPIKR